MSDESPSSVGGLQLRNKNDINNTLFCEICKLLLLEPVQLLCCGVRSCRWCSKKGLLDSEPFVCPFCNVTQPKKQTRTDRGVERELNMIKIECYACNWNGSYKDYKEHLQQQHADLECNFCREHFYAINLYEEHRQEICDRRSIPCGLPGCTELIKWNEMGQHYICDTHQKMILNVMIAYFHLTNPAEYINNSMNYLEQEFHNVDRSINAVQPGIDTLSNENSRLRSEHDQTKLTYERIFTQMNETKQFSNELNEKVNKYGETQIEIEKELDNTKILHSTSEISSLDVDGTITFPFAKTSNEFKSPFSLYSSTFKTSKYGYPFNLRVCSTIETSYGSQPYLSVYITLLRGEFDPILFYPFPYNIFISLCDQSGQRKHITSILKPDPISSSFARPTSERNPEIGIPNFCPLNHLADAQSIYLKDGVFFLRVFIDFMDANQLPFT